MPSKLAKTPYTKAVDNFKESLENATSFDGNASVEDSIDSQIQEGMNGDVLAFPVYYKIDEKLYRVFFRKDLTRSSFSEYIKHVADPKHWRSVRHANAMASVMVVCQDPKGKS